jgi:hypothetical protein
VITALDAKAQALGAGIGMAVAKAQALAPGLVVLDADPAADTDGAPQAGAVGAAAHLARGRPIRRMGW